MPFSASFAGDMNQDWEVAVAVGFSVGIKANLTKGKCLVNKILRLQLYYTEVWNGSNDLSGSLILRNLLCVEALEVDFVNKCIGGGALRRGCVQEEIRFMINPELIVGMLFLPAMAGNEAIEIIGTQRFSNYSGYASSFCFCADYKDVEGADSMGRRKTRIIAIDALSRVGKRQYTPECLLREINKAFCGFYDQYKRQQYENLFVDIGFSEAEFDEGIRSPLGNSTRNLSTSFQSINETNNQPMRDNEPKWDDDNVSIATGNWGCGAFGGDPEVKTIIQWLAASQTLRS
ncbi:unnamed protein product [Fraxinus pennsylvanica]|uniref:PARG catalytic Macro domain-containing protein n=1 Tax=Fraxinus pennsylvanica TaxID=56036 RepID=A0AAD1ZCL7_9LAMI|nr:unnamed protein product [Fraxinus pennsylvanica]